MSIVHSLTDPSDITTCFDPVAGLSDGTTVGKSYIVRRLFEHFLAIHPNAKEITNASPTPAWLQEDAAYASYYNIPTGVAVNRSTAGDYVRFYYDNDPGLSQSTPNCIVHTWQVHPTSANYNAILFPVVHFKVSGSTIVNPATQPVINYTSNSFYDANLQWMTNSATQTSFANIPKFVVWASFNATIIISVNRITSAFISSIIMYRPTNWTGYTNNAVITPGANFNAIIHSGWSCEWVIFEAITNLFEFRNGSYNATGDASFPFNAQVISSLGRLPANLFTLAGTNRLIAGKMVVSICNSNMVAVSGEIEGVLLANSNAVLPACGISTYNGSSRYLSGSHVQDGVSLHKMLLQLS